MLVTTVFVTTHLEDRPAGPHIKEAVFAESVKISIPYGTNQAVDTCVLSS